MRSRSSSKVRAPLDTGRIPFSCNRWGTRPVKASYSRISGVSEGRRQHLWLGSWDNGTARHRLRRRVFPRKPCLTRRNNNEGTIFNVDTTQATLKFPQDFPFHPPTFTFNSEFFHPNVYTDGESCAPPFLGYIRCCLYEKKDLTNPMGNEKVNCVSRSCIHPVMIRWGTLSDKWMTKILT